MRRTATRSPARLRRRGAIIATAVLAAAVAAPAARGEVVERQRAATSIAAWDGYAAWSRYEGPRRFRLVIWHEGRIRRAAVPARAAAFDVDLGLDARGRVVAVYSRCARIDRQQPLYWLPVHAFDDRCDLYVYDVEARRERRLARPSRRASSEFLPAIDRGRLVFARNAPVRGRSPRVPELVSAQLSPYREQRLARPRGRANDAVTDRNLGPNTIDAADGLAVVGWNHVPPRSACGNASFPITITIYQVLLYDLAGRGRRALEDDCVRITPEMWFLSPSLSDGAVYYTYSPAVSEDRFGLRRFDVKTGARTDAPAGPHNILSTQTGGGWTWSVADVVVDRRHTIEIMRTPAPLLR